MSFVKSFHHLLNRGEICIEGGILLFDVVDNWHLLTKLHSDISAHNLQNILALGIQSSCPVSISSW